MWLVLDSGPLGLLSHPDATGAALEAQDWAQSRLAAGDQIFIPEIADYEVRRELLRAKKRLGLARLDELAYELKYLPLKTPMMREASILWANARNAGFPTAHDAALDGDVILAAQARSIQPEAGSENVVVATTNVSHLSRYVEAKHWTDI